VRPGLSGLAQISGRNSISWEDKFKLDLQYIENVSFKNDWKIIFMSIKKAFCREGINSDTAVTMDEFRGSQEGREPVTESTSGIKMKKKVLFVATVMYHFQAFHLPYMKMLQENGYEEHIAANGKIELPYCDKCYVIPIERSPYKINNLKAYKTLKKIIQTEQFDIVHCHTPMGGIIARLSANKLRKNGTKVIYTAHGFHFFKGAPLINWLIYYPVERLFAKFTDILITINQEDYARAQKFKAGKVVYIPGVGIDTNKYAPVETDKAEKRRELGIPENSFVMLSVGELSKRKNQEVIIKAIAKLNNTDIQYLICGEGSLVEYLKRLAATLGIEKQVQLLGFRRDIAEICQACDSFVFPSLQEGLPVALMEAMAGGMPVVCSDIRGNTDLIQNGKGGIMVKPNDVEGFANAIGKLIQNKELQRAMRAANLKTIKSFDLSAIIKDMEALYMEV
jgi:glycosyltransferase EpsD